MLSKLKNNKNYIWAFLIPFLIFILLCFSLGFLYPDGKAFYISDLDAQYKALFAFYRENGLVGYSFSKGLGGSMFGTYAYYLASPLNVITFLFPTKYLHLSMLLILGIKLSLASLTMYIFLHQHFKEKKYLLLFSIIYAFIGFNAAYYFHLMWFDAVYLLPLIMTGIDQILKNKKSILYLVSLFL